jgi:hypothetical protein
MRGVPFEPLPLYYLVLAGYVVVYLGLNWNGHKSRLTPALPYYLSYMNDFAPLRGNTPYQRSCGRTETPGLQVR